MEFSNLHSCNRDYKWCSYAKSLNVRLNFILPVSVSCKSPSNSRIVLMNCSCIIFFIKKIKDSMTPQISSNIHLLLTMQIYNRYVPSLLCSLLCINRICIIVHYWSYQCRKYEPNSPLNHQPTPIDYFVHYSPDYLVLSSTAHCTADKVRYLS